MRVTSIPGAAGARAINFNDTSTNSPTSWTWYATNNTPGNNTEFVFSTVKAPTATFGVGNWSIKVRTTSSTGSSNSSVQLLKGISLAGYTYYPSDHVYNVDISKLPINPKTSSWITTEGSSDFMYLTRFIYLTPVDNAQPTQYFTKILLAGGDNVPVPIPNGINIQGNTAFGGDTAYNIVNPQSGNFYEGYKPVQAASGTWSTSTSVLGQVNNYTQRQVGYTGEGASGMRYTPLTATYDEIKSGTINHALMIVMPYSNDYVWPATKGGQYNTQAPPLGTRFRLNASFDETGYTAQQKSLLDALKKYGAFFTDQGQTGQFNIVTEYPVTSLGFTYRPYNGGSARSHGAYVRPGSGR